MTHYSDHEQEEEKLDILVVKNMYPRPLVIIIVVENAYFRPLVIILVVKNAYHNCCKKCVFVTIKGIIPGGATLYFDVELLGIL